MCSRKKITITGHRGAAGLAPENTLAAIELGLSYGVDRIEVDIQQTKDYKVVILHDRTIDRTTNGNGKIKDYNYDDVKLFKAAANFSSNYKDERIPLLEEVFQLINGKAQLLIEIKEGNEYFPNIEKNTIDLIRKYKAESWSIIQSFNDKALFKAYSLAPDLIYHKLFVFDVPYLPFFYDETINFKHFKDYHFIAEFSLSTKFTNKRIINKIHKLGKKLNAWTVKDKENGQTLINLGVDGLITDFPNFFLPEKENKQN